MDPDGEAPLFDAPDARPRDDLDRNDPADLVDHAVEDPDADLWGSSGGTRGGDRRGIVVAIGAVAILALGFVLFDGGSDDSTTASTASTVTTTTALTAGSGPGAATPPAGAGATTQVTSQPTPDGAVTLTPSTLPAGAVPGGCGDWDAAFNFPPVEMTEGVFIWSGFDGWHVRLAGDAPGIVTGSVTGQQVPELYSAPEAPGVTTTIDDANNRLSFELTAGDQPVGIDFNAGCAQHELTFELTTNGSPVPVESIHLGKRGVVEELPLVARRTLPEPG